MRLIALILMVCISLSAYSEETYRDFMDTQGRTVRAKILSFDGHSKKLKIQRDNGKVVSVPASIFSTEDQVYIQSWLKYEGVRSTSKFKMEFNRRSIKSWSKERIGRINYTDGSHEDNQVVGKTDYDEFGYEITIDNKNKYALSGLKLEYCIFYEQEVNAKRKDPEQGVLHGTMDLEEIAAQSKRKVNTKSVTVYKDESNAEFINSAVVRGEILGITARVYSHENGKKELLRYEGMPKSLLDGMAWTETSHIISIPK